MSSRKRHHESEDEGRITTDEEEGEIDDQHRGRSHKGKKSKKHKKDKKHKSKKRSRRRSDSEVTDKEGGSTPEIEAGEVLEISDEEDSRGKREKSWSPPPIKDRKEFKLQRSPSPDPGPLGKGGGSVESLSIEETNKLRASLGLPPLKLDKPKKEEKVEDNKDDGKEGTAIPNSDVRHKPAENLTQKSATEKMRERLMQRKMKRQQESKLLKVSTLGAENDDVDDTAKWLQRQKKKEKEKKAAEKRAKMLAELDDEFGVGNMVKEDVGKDQAYDSRNLAGLTVEHDASNFTDGKTVILTLKDADILDETAGDSLVNVNMIDDEKVAKNKDNIRKAKVGYNPYDQEEIDEETGELRRKNMLDKYDEEIDGEKKKSFRIGAQGSFSQDEERELNRAKIRQKLANVETLATPQYKVASDYYTEAEVVQFKKPKKKKKVKRKMLKADDLLGLETPSSEVKKEPLDSKGALPMDVDDDEPIKTEIDDEELAKIKVDQDDDLDLQLALKKARRIKQRKKFDEDQFLLENGLTNIKHEAANEENETSNGAEFITTFSDDKSSNIITINETSEFCRNLGAIRSYEGSGLGDSLPKEIRDFEEQVTDPSRKRSRRPKSKKYDSDDDDKEGQRFSGGYFDEDDSQDDEKNAVILDEEPDLQSGVAAAIKLAANKGYWETEEKAIRSSKLKHLEARHYTIEDKGSDDRHSRRGDRYGGGGPTQTFQEKSDYKPNVKLEYHDDSGRPLNRKEAFRHLSHKFHGKTSGKLKCEKRQKKVQEESLMKNMSSTDTPLQTTEKLRQRQREAATPYVILTGNKVQATDLRK